MAWRLAKSLDKLRSQVNAMAPGRSKISDGTIGDSAHSSRSSDHNPSGGVVHALDITHDPHNGCDANKIAESIRANRDPRVSYIIWNKKIANSSIQDWAWRPYSGSNPHTKHVHFSVKKGAKADDTTPWKVNSAYDTSTPLPPQRPLLKKGAKTDSVRILQALLKIPVDGDFGPKTHAAVVSFQKAKGLHPDGKVGPYTWDALYPQTPSTALPVAENKPRTPRELKTSPKGRAHIKEFEGCELEAHKVGGIWHIGIGHSSTSGKQPIPEEGMTITAEEAEAILGADLLEYEILLANEVEVDLTQGQFDALISIAFNKGPTWFRKSALLKAVNAQDWDRAALAILAEHPGVTHKFYKGLARRRKAEAALFRS
jgi:GH24 family phage-related lysozyme (muramidase)